MNIVYSLIFNENIEQQHQQHKKQMSSLQSQIFASNGKWNYYYIQQRRSSTMHRKHQQHRSYPVKEFNSDRITNWRFRAQLEFCQIWQSIDDETIAQAYPIYNRQSLAIREQHSQNQQHVIKSLGYCSINAHRNYLLIQRVLNRLSECMNLTEAQALKILYSIFKGLEQLVPIFGIFGIQQNCVCFTDNGKIKIWINQDLSSIATKYNYNNSNPGAQKVVIWDTISMIEKKCFNQKIFMDLKRKVQNGRIKVYSHVYREISKMAEMLFIDIGEKKNESVSRHHHHYSRHQEMESCRDFHHSNITNFQSNKSEKRESKADTNQYDRLDTDRSYNTAQEQMQQQKCTYSQNTKKTQGYSHKRYRSYVDHAKNTHCQDSQKYKDNNLRDNQCYPQINSLANASNSQSVKAFNQQCYKSAPLSPRQVQPKSFFKKTSLKINNNLIIEKMLENKRKDTLTAQKKQSFQAPYSYGLDDLQRLKKRQKTKTMLVTLNDEPAQQIHSEESELYRLSQSEKSKQIIEDSFANNLKIQINDIQVKGDFQTFGLLDALSDKRLDRSQNSGVLDRTGSNCFMDLDVEAMDRQLRKKLQKKKVRKSQRSSINKSPTLVQIEKLQLDNHNELDKSHENQFKNVFASNYSKSPDPKNQQNKYRQLSNASNTHHLSNKAIHNQYNNTPIKIEQQHREVENIESIQSRYMKAYSKTQNNEQIQEKTENFLTVKDSRPNKENIEMKKINNIKHVDVGHSRTSFHQPSISSHANFHEYKNSNGIDNMPNKFHHLKIRQVEQNSSYPYAVNYRHDVRYSANQGGLQRIL